LQCATICDTLTFAWDGLKYGLEKYRYAIRNVVEVVMLSSKVCINVKATSNCVGFNNRTRKRVVKQWQLLDAQVEEKKWAKGDKKQ